MSNIKKLPLGKTLNQAIQRRIVDAIQLEGKSLPCSVVSVSGAIVTIKFELNSTYTLPNVRLPIIGSIYARAPIQPGDLGIVRPIDTYLGGVSGLGGGVASLGQRANLATLVFEPIGNSNWASVPAGSFVLQGPTGVILQTMQGTLVTLNLSSTGIAINCNGGTVTVTNGDVIADGISLKTHTHPVTNIQTGTSTIETGAPVE